MSDVVAYLLGLAMILFPFALFVYGALSVLQVVYGTQSRLLAFPFY